MNDSGYYTPGFTFLDDEFEYGDPGPSLFCIIHVVDDTIPAADVRKVTPPTGDNVVKLTGTLDDDMSQGDLYLEFSQLTKAVPVDSDGMEYHIPVGSSVTVYWYYNGEFQSLDPDTGGGIVLFDFVDAQYQYTFPEDKVNDDGTITLTFTEPGIYKNDSVDFQGAYWQVSPEPTIVVESAVSDPTPTPTTPTFTDVPNWCAEAAEYMAEHKLMNGTGENRFSPNETTTRGMLMTILARADGEDTAGDPWYKAGMEWCVGAKVSDGTKPEATVTRQEIATMLWRYFDEPACDETPDFPDASSVDSWAVTAVNWCVYNGIITGKDGSLDPTGLATRAEAATTVYRAITQAAA